MPTTTNFGWTTPADTDLVKDGASAIRTLGNGIDTSLLDLKGGTTGQLLSKASNTDLDFTWTAAGIPATIVDAKGDLIAATAADTVSRLAVGSNDQVLTADSSTATGLKWAAVNTEKTFTLINTGGTALTGATTITVSSLGGYTTYYVLMRQASSVSGNSGFTLTVNGATTGAQANYSIEAQGTYNNGIFTAGSSITSGTINLGSMGTGSAQVVNGACIIFGGGSTGLKSYTAIGGAQYDSSSANNRYYSQIGLINPGAAITSMTLTSSTGNFDNGTIYIYGAA